MKKLSKKQKLIIIFATIIVIVIIGIVIGVTIIKRNISNGEYDAANGSSSNKNLIPEYIKEGITLGGVTGTLKDLDTSDATATAEDILEGKVAYARGERIVGTMKEGPEPIEILDPDEVYYADIEGDGEVDGVIFADLAVGGSGTWGSMGAGYYKIPTETNLKQYYIKDENYSNDFGEGKIIAPIEGTNGNDRFYVMKLDDFNSGTEYCWYDDAEGKLDNGVGPTEDDFGKGRTNTATMIAEWNKGENGKYGQQNTGTYDDVWGAIQEEVGEDLNNPKWFIPSKSEWAAFGEAFNIMNSNMNTYNLSNSYWSSSHSSGSAWVANIGLGSITGLVVYGNCFVRLATTF